MVEKRQIGADHAHDSPHSPGPTISVPYSLNSIRANPFRNIERYPIRPEKVEALRRSIRTTGFWNNIVARSVDGGAEIAYGHHRLAALLEEYGPDHLVHLNIRDLSDAEMLRMMADENLEDWGTSADVELGVIRAVVESFAAGRIELALPSERANKSVLRYAPSFIPGDASRASGTHEKVYTAQTVGRFLGWVKPSGDAQDKVGTLLTILQFVEKDCCEEADFDGLSITQAAANIQQVRATREDAERRAQNAERGPNIRLPNSPPRLKNDRSPRSTLRRRSEKSRRLKTPAITRLGTSRCATRRRQRVTRSKPRRPACSRTSGSLLRPISRTIN